MTMLPKRRGRTWTVFVCAGGLLLFAVLGACSPRSKKPHTPPVSTDQIRLLEPARLTEGGRGMMTLLDELFPGTPLLGGADVVDELADCLREKRVLLVPAASEVPVDLWDPLKQYLDSGGAAVFIGPDPFTSRIRRPHGAPQSEKELHTSLRTRARHVEGLSAIQLWQHQNESDALRGVVRLGKNAGPEWGSVLVEADGFRDWDAMVQDDIAPGLIGSDDNTLVFYARTDTKLTHLAIECVEEDGSHWTQTIPVDAAWTPHVLHAWRFTHFHGGEGRGGEGDRLKLARVKKIKIGPSMHLAQQAPGDHVYELSDVRLARDPRSDQEVVGWPNIPLLSPPYRYYTTTAHAVSPVEGGRPVALRSSVQSSLPRERGVGGEAAPAHRWIPLYEALDKKGEVRGWPASLYIEHVPDHTVRKWAWIGVDATESSQAVLKNMIEAAVQQLRYGRFLFKAGMPMYSLYQGKAITVSARWTPGAEDERPLRIRAELLRKDGTVLRRVISDGESERRAYLDRPVQVSLGLVPRVEYEPRNFRVRVTLEDASGSGEEYDAVEQAIKIYPALDDEHAEDRLAVTGSRFTYRRRPVFLMGMNYWPVSVNGRHPAEETQHWLRSGAFDAELIGRDLDRLADVGVNAVAIQYLDESEAPQVEYFVHEAKKRDIWVYLFVSALNPLEADYERAERLLADAHIAQQSRIFAIDVAWEPHLGHEEHRRRLDVDWLSWIKEQYGSVSHAETVLGSSIWRRDGEVTGPPDEALSRDGEHRSLVAAYRRFVHDYMSRRYGYVRRFLQWQGCKQLISARTGYGGTGQPWPDPQLPIDPATGAVHMDFISPEAWGLYGDHDAFLEAGFITAYARGVSAGKPVLWLEYGANLGRTPQASSYTNQVRVYDHMFDMVFRSMAAGSFGWWYPGGYRVDEGSDYGVVNPDGTWRGADEAFKRAGQRIRREKAVPQPWRDREADIDADARGLSALWDQWRDRYRDEMVQDQLEELRPIDFGKLTTEIEPVGVGGVQHIDPSPLRSVNAEWTYVEVDGEHRLRKPGEPIVVREQQHLKVELMNTGWSTWVASRQDKQGSVWVRFDHAERNPHHAKVGKVPFGDNAVINWRASDVGTWQMRPVLEGVGSFGETLEVIVEAL